MRQGSAEVGVSGKSKAAGHDPDIFFLPLHHDPVSPTILAYQAYFEELRRQIIAASGVPAALLVACDEQSGRFCRSLNQPHKSSQQLLNR